MTDIVWEEPAIHGGSSKIRWAFAEELRRNPGRWAVIPEAWTSINSTKINRGEIAAFKPAGAFESLGRSGKTYVRYIGEVA